MRSIRQIEALNKRELEDCIKPEASWHRDYADTAFIYIGGLDDRLTEGDVLIIFSQYGEPVFLNLVRDKETGKSKGFAFLKYEDQRSCDLAVDNLSGAQVLGRLLSVEHTRYKKRDNEDLSDNTKNFGIPPVGQEAQIKFDDDDTEKEDVSDVPDSEEYDRPLLKEEIELQKLMDLDDEDPMKMSMIQQKTEQLQLARKSGKDEHRHRSEKSHRSSKSKQHKSHKSRRRPSNSDSDRS